MVDRREGRGALARRLPRGARHPEERLELLRGAAARKLEDEDEPVNGASIGRESGVNRA